MMKSVFFLAVLVNLIFFLWQYNAGAFHHGQNKIQIANKTPKQIWLVSELPPPSPPVPVEVSAINNDLNTTTPSLNLTAPLSIITPVEPNHQQGVTSRISNEAQIPSAAPVTTSETSEPIKTPEPIVVATSEKTAAVQTPVETIPPSDNKESTQVSKTPEIAVSETIKPTQVSEPTVVATPETEQPNKEPSPVKTFYCYQINGFSNKKTALHWGKQQAVDSASLQVKDSPEVTDYIVYYPVATPVESKKNMASLKKQGISHFMIHQGELKGALSLGVFKNESYAIKVQQNLVKKGIPAKVAKRNKTAAAISIQIKTEKNKSQLLATLARHNPKPSVKLLSKCD